MYICMHGEGGGLPRNPTSHIHMPAFFILGFLRHKSPSLPTEKICRAHRGPSSPPSPLPSAKLEQGFFTSKWESTYSVVVTQSVLDAEASVEANETMQVLLLFSLYARGLSPQRSINLSHHVVHAPLRPM